MKVRIQCLEYIEVVIITAEPEIVADTTEDSVADLSPEFVSEYRSVLAKYRSMLEDIKSKTLFMGDSGS